MTEIYETLQTMGAQAKQAAWELANFDSTRKTKILSAMAGALESATGPILQANRLDRLAAESMGLSEALLSRLELTESKISGIANGIRKVAELNDPVGESLESWDHDKGFRIEKVRVPLGVIGIIYESRPNVTADASVLCFKSGNATILRGGKEAIHSNQAIVKALQEGGRDAGMPTHAIQLVPFTDREGVKILAEMDEALDLIIPRGGRGLIEAVVSAARVPVIKHYEGICHTFVSENADLEKAIRIVVDAKTQKPGVCNALETLLLDRAVAEDFLIAAWPRLTREGVQLRGDEFTRNVLGDGVQAADEIDWTTEYLDLILSIRVVDTIADAIEHINRYGSHHSDCIVTESSDEAEEFLRQVDSACVYHNVSTRFSDGEEFGFGAEIGISTDKLHARGPMGLKELTSYQYRIRGDGQLKSDV